MTTGLITPTEGQEKQLDRIIEDAVRRVRKEVLIDRESMQKLLANGGKLQEDIVNSLIKHSVDDSRFYLQSSFRFTVPRGYIHGTQLATFYSYREKNKFYRIDRDITDENYARATHALIPGKSYSAKIFGINQGKSVSTGDCLRFLALRRAILVGAQGLSLVRQLKKDGFPMGQWTLSFDENDALWQNSSGEKCIPNMQRHHDHTWAFTLCIYGGYWSHGFSFLCVSELAT